MAPPDGSPGWLSRMASRMALRMALRTRETRASGHVCVAVGPGLLLFLVFLVFLVAAYLTVTVAPAPSRAVRALSALSLLTFSSTVLGAPSTRSLASFRPRLVRLRTSLMSWIFL